MANLCHHDAVHAGMPTLSGRTGWLTARAAAKANTSAGSGNNFDGRTQGIFLHGQQHAGQHAAAATSNEDRVDGARMLAQDFLANSAASQQSPRVIVGMNKYSVFPGFASASLGGGLVKGVAMQHHGGATRLHRSDFDRRGWCAASRWSHQCPVSRPPGATPCAWFPAEAAITPAARSSAESCIMRL